jgi:hypothetical protein
MAAKKKTKPKAAPRKRKPKADHYSEILAMLDQLLDSAEDDLSRAALDPVAAVRAKCATLTVALRMCLLALSCHGQKEDFARQIAENLDQIVSLKTRWNEESGQEEIGERIIQGIAIQDGIEESAIEIGEDNRIAAVNASRSQRANEVRTPRPEKRRFELVEEIGEVDESDDYTGPQEVESGGYAADENDDEID